MTTFEINGTSLEYVERGSGETVLLVHGSNSDYRTWQGQLDEFSSDFRTIAYSRRYHYPNEKIAEGADYAMQEQVDDLQQVIQKLDAGPVHVVGHSYGAFLALLLAIQNPELIRSLVLTEPPVVTLFISIPPKPQQILKLLVTRPRTAIALIQFAITGLNPAVAAAERDDMEEALRIFTVAVLGKEGFKNLSEERLQQGQDNNIKAEFLGSGFLPVDESEVSQVQVPTLLINGANSPAMFRRLNDRLHELLPNSERTVILGASHIVHEDNPAAFDEAVVRFLNKQQ